MPHGIKKHLKRVNAPSAWNLDKMGGKWAPTVSSGPHKGRESMPLILILRNKLNYALDGKEAMQIAMQRNVLVDGKVRTDTGFPCGFMDVVTIPKTNDAFRVLFDEKARFVLQSISEEETKFKLCQVINTRTGLRGIPALSTHDGRTIRYPDPNIKVGDTVKIDLKTGKIIAHLKKEAGMLCFVCKGRNTGRVGVLIKRERHLGSYDIATLQDAAGTVFAVRLSAVFVIGEGAGKSHVTLPRGNGVKLSIIDERNSRNLKVATA